MNDDLASYLGNKETVIFLSKILNEYVHAKSIKTADACILDGDVLQHPTIPVVNETNMKKKATIKSAIIARDISEIKKILGLLYFESL